MFITLAAMRTASTLSDDCIPKDLLCVVKLSVLAYVDVVATGTKKAI